MNPPFLTILRGLTRFGRLVWVFGLLVGLAACAPAASSPTPAAGPVTDDQVNAVAHQLYCPICQNVPLDTCSTLACARWRDLIREKLGEGWSNAQINDYFARQYGARVLAEPPPQGFNTLVYALPPLLLLIVLAFAWRVFYTLRTPMPPSAPHGPGGDDLDPNDPYLAQMEEALRRRKE